jgi:hypothetical protein
LRIKEQEIGLILYENDDDDNNDNDLLPEFGAYEPRNVV